MGEGFMDRIFNRGQHPQEAVSENKGVEKIDHRFLPRSWRAEVQGREWRETYQQTLEHSQQVAEAVVESFKKGPANDVLQGLWLAHYKQQNNLNFIYLKAEDIVYDPQMGRALVKAYKIQHPDREVNQTADPAAALQNLEVQVGKGLHYAREFDRFDLPDNYYEALKNLKKYQKILSNYH